MLTDEAAWLQRHLAAIPSDALDPLLSIGSGTAHSREVLQPWIDERIYAPLERRGVRVIHHEYAAAEGVDIAGNIADPQVAAALQEVGAQSVLCCNVLEHLAERGPATDLLASLVEPGGYLIVTVPRHFPYHPDPIDTMFRPSVAELAGLFEGFELEDGEEVACGTLFSYLHRSGSVTHSVVNGIKVAMSRLGRGSQADEGGGVPSASPSARPDGAEGPLRYLVRSTAVTCVILRRPG
jgi:hypothetical protein